MFQSAPLVGEGRKPCALVAVHAGESFQSAPLVGEGRKDSFCTRSAKLDRFQSAPLVGEGRKVAVDVGSVEIIVSIRAPRG